MPLSENDSLADQESRTIRESAKPDDILEFLTEEDRKQIYEEEKQRQEANTSRQSGQFAAFVMLLVSLLLLVPFLLFWRYGAITPCGALSKAVYTNLQYRAAQGEGNRARALGRQMGASLSFFLVQSQINSLSTGQCASQLIRLETRGENPYASS